MITKNLLEQVGQQAKYRGYNIEKLEESLDKLGKLTQEQRAIAIKAYYAAA